MVATTRIEVQKRTAAIRRIYMEFSTKLTALQKRHREETVQLLNELEQRQIEELRKKISQE